MRMTWISVGIVATLSTALMSINACGNSSTGGSGATGGAGGTGGAAGGAGGGTGGAGGSAGPDCTCACTTLMSASGCADLCDDAQNGNPNSPNYCNSSAALSECSACLSSKCNFTDAEIADTTACQ